ncbi:MAG TPA: ABC transporter ATP-binding protein [Thermoanaerobaculia bacterium]|nr:ABC transporter ATP-binding protein [Thermoanaerobaculia bacterium]
MTPTPAATPDVSPTSGLLVEGLCKRYPGGTLANDEISLRVDPGEVFGLLGPNGAGKTTLVRQIIGLLRPTGGRIELEGEDLVAHPDRARELCSYLPQGALPLDSFRGSELVELVGRVRGGDRRAVRARAEQLLGALELEEWRGTFGHRLSGGVRRLLGFAMAAVWPGSLVILDEPTNDVDPLRRRLLWRQVRQLAGEGRAVLLVTHNVLEAEQSVDRLAVIDGGRILAQGTPSALKADQRGRLRLRVTLPAPGEVPAIPALGRGHVVLGRRLELLLDEADAPEALHWARVLLEQGRIEEYALAAATLEDVYVRLIGREDALDLNETGTGGGAS